MSQTGEALALFTGTLVVWAATVLLVMGGVALLSGWRRLAEAYPCPGGCPKPRYWLGSMVFRGWMGYNNGVIVSADGQALHLTAMPVVLSPTHPPIAIPWSEILEIREARRWFGTLYEVSTRRLPDLRWGLRPRAFERVRAAAVAAGVKITV